MSDDVQARLQAASEADLRELLAGTDLVRADVAKRDEVRHFIGSEGKVRGIVTSARLDTANETLRELIQAELWRRGIEP